MNQDLLRKAEVYCGYGKAWYPMMRGSFRHREVSGYRKLRPEEYGTVSYQRENGFGHLHIELQDPKQNRIRIVLPGCPGEHFYGCGETFSELDLKGQRVRIWTAEHQNSNRISQKLAREKILGVNPKRKLPFGRYESYYVQPTVVSSKKYFLHADGSNYMDFDFRNPAKTIITIRDAKTADIWMGTAPTMEQLLTRKHELLGGQGLLPDWIYDGVIIASQGGTERIEEHIRNAEEAGVPVCGVWSQDWCGCRRTGFGYQVMWNWQWDEELYPGLDDRIPEWKAKGIHMLGYINPFMALEKNLYKEASKKGYCVKNKKGEDYQVTITTFPAAMIDLTNPDAWEWMKRVIRTNMIDLGLSGWMADFGEYLPADAVLYRGDAKELHNAWPAMWAKLNREAVEESGKANEIFFFTRAGFTSTITESPMMWNGDQHVDWSVDDGIGSVIPATLSLAMSGYGICHSDIGGYTTMMHMKRSKELLMRWEEMNTFSPMMRMHEGNQPVNNVQFDCDSEALEHLAHLAGIHVKLKPYLKDAVAENAESGIPVMRPLFLYYPEKHCSIEKEEYLLGRDLLVAPVIEQGAQMRMCYLPEDTWIHTASGKEYRGGYCMVQAPLGQPPVFVRKYGEAAEFLLEILSER